MCGIAGLLAAGSRDGLEERTAAMVRALRHRGPDDEGFFAAAGIALGVRRLSIIDVAGGHQPMRSDDESLHIVFNGEIYNHRELRQDLMRLGHRFRTQCDTEVVLRGFEEWGPEVFPRLHGMFGVALWDAREQVLTVARDRMGQKSIFYTETPLGWAFASEIKGLLASGLIEKRIDLLALSHYMSLRYLPDHRTLFAGVCKLPAAHYARIGRESRTLVRYWTPSYEPKTTLGETEIVDELDRLIGNAVEDHLMSEVPLGSFLSGGIDSSLVVAYASSRSRSSLATFSIGVDEASQSELPWARTVAERYRTHHFERIVQPDLAALTPRMIAALEEPVDPFAAGVYVVSEITARQVTVALGGDGGDELFGGYDRYAGQRLAEVVSQVPAGLRRRAFAVAHRLVPESFGYKSLAQKLRWLERVSTAGAPAIRYAEAAAFLRFPHDFKRALFAPDVWRDLDSSASESLLAVYFNDGSAQEEVDQMLHTDCMTRLSDHLLPSVDRMSMAHSLEVRCPLLDNRVVDFALKIPARLKVNGRTLKYVARRVAERHLPRDLVYRRKQGFGFPLALWLRGDLRPLIQSVAAESRLAADGIFQKGEMTRLVDEHLGGGIDHNFRLWMLFNLELWYRHHIDGVSVGELEDWVERCRTPWQGRHGIEPSTVEFAQG